MDRDARLGILDLALALRRLEALGFEVAPVRDRLKAAFESGSFEPLLEARDIVAAMASEAGRRLLEAA